MNIESLIEAAKGSKHDLVTLKDLAIKARDYDTAVLIRDLESQLYPVTEQDQKDRERADTLTTLFRMVGMKMSDEVCFVVDETIKQFNKKKGKFDLVDAVKITERARDLFS